MTNDNERIVKRYAYARVSTLAQKVDRQIRAFKKFNVDKVFIDKQSGKDFERAAYRELITTLQKGDVVYIKSIDRLGRNYREITEQWRIITKIIGADVVVIDMPLLDTRSEKNLLGTFISDIVLQILSFVAENERAYILERQREGIDAAQRRGVRFGRPPATLPDNFRDIVAKEAAGIYKTIAEAASVAGLTISTYRRHAEKVKKTFKTNAFKR